MRVVYMKHAVRFSASSLALVISSVNGFSYGFSNWFSHLFTIGMQQCSIHLGVRCKLARVGLCTRRQ